MPAMPADLEPLRLAAMVAHEAIVEEIIAGLCGSRLAEGAQPSSYSND